MRFRVFALKINTALFLLMLSVTPLCDEIQYYPKSLGEQFVEGELALRGKIILEQRMFLSKTDLDGPAQ